MRFNAIEKIGKQTLWGWATETWNFVISRLTAAIATMHACLVCGSQQWCGFVLWCVFCFYVWHCCVVWCAFMCGSCVLLCVAGRCQLCGNYLGHRTLHLTVTSPIRLESDDDDLVSCPTRWSLYWYLGFYDDHPEQRNMVQQCTT